MKLVIYRDNWSAYKYRVTCLKDRLDRTYCCLGFLGKALGYSDEQLEGQGIPDGVPTNKRIVWPGGARNETYTRLIGVNDAVGIPIVDKEVRIAALMNTIGVDVTFVDGEMPQENAEVPSV